MPLSAVNILSHAMNSIMMFVDVLIVAYPIRLYHVIQPICFGVSFGIFSFIYYLCDGVDMYVNLHCIAVVFSIEWIYFHEFIFHFRKGNHFIYPVLDWSKPGKSMVTVFGTLILAIMVHIMLFWIYKLRVFIHRRFISTKLMLPTKTPTDQFNKTGGSQISMVFGDDGCTNQAFTSRSNNMNK